MPPSKPAAPLTLEQVYQLQNEWRAYYPPGARRVVQKPLVLTSLAAQACRQEGIDPRDLMFAEIWQFAEPNVSEEIQLMRHSAYMQLREEKMDTVVRARDGILSAKAHREALSKAVESKVKPPKIPPRVSSSGPNKGLVAHEVNIALLRAKAMEARRFESMDASVKKQEDEALLRLEAQEMLREADLKAKADVREHRIRVAASLSKTLEDRRARRARRRIIKKFLKSAALQMTSLEDVEKQSELKMLKEQKRKDFVARAARKQEFRVTQIQQSIQEKEQRIKATERAKQDALHQLRLRAQAEVVSRQRILNLNVPSSLKARPSVVIEAELAEYAGVALHAGGRRVLASGRPMSRAPRLLVSPASFPSFGVWMLLQHFKLQHDVTNVQVLDRAGREAFAPKYSPLIPTLEWPDGDRVRGVSSICKALLHTLCDSSGLSPDALLPSSGPEGAIVASVMALVEPLYCRTLQYVLPLISPLMRSWEVALTEEELKKWKANDSVPEDGKEGGTVPPPTGDGDPTAAPQAAPLDELLRTAGGILRRSGASFCLGSHVSLTDFALIPPFHMLLLAGFPLPDQILDYLAAFASTVPALIELEEPLCVLFQRLNGDENPPPPRPSSPAAATTEAPAKQASRKHLLPKRLHNRARTSSVPT